MMTDPTIATNPAFSKWISALIIAFSVTLAALLPRVTSAQDIVVNTNSGAPFLAGSNDGLCSLAEAINNANAAASTAMSTLSPDCPDVGSPPLTEAIEVEIADGLGVIDLDGVVLIRSPIKLVGPSPTNKGRITTSGDQGIFAVRAASIAAINAQIFEFRNLELFGSTKTSAPPNLARCEHSGGAICISLSRPDARVTIIDSEFRLNEINPSSFNSFLGGGALSVGASSTDVGQRLLIENTTFDRNITRGSGGAVLAGWVATTILDSRFESNEASSGGAVKAQGSASLSINRSTFIGNTATPTDAAALEALGIQTVVITHSRFELNSVYVFDGQQITSDNLGHAVTVNGFGTSSSNLLMLNTEFDRNNTGAIKLSSGINATIGSTLVHVNRASASSKGVVSVRDSTLDMFNSSVVGNIGLPEFPHTPMAGIRAESSTLNLEHVTISDNWANGSSAVGGLHLVDSSTANLSGTLLAGNEGVSGGNALVEGGSVLNVHSSQFGDSAAEINGSSTANVFNDNAGLDAIQDMGCTVPAGDSMNSRCIPLAPLAAGAVALDRSDPATTLLSDQRGLDFTRKSGGGNVPDIGAHETQPPLISIDPDTNTAFNEGSSGTTPFPFTLRRNGDKRANTFANWNIFGDGPTPANVDDFQAASWVGGSAFFDVGAESAQVNINVIGDTFSEPNEGFRLVLAGITNGQQGDVAQRSATIINDDALLPAAFVSIAPVVINSIEGDFFIGSRQTFRITRSQLLSGICSFQVELSAIGPAGVSNDDFLNWNLGTSTYILQPGEESFEITLDVVGDGMYEGDEAFRVGLINPSGCFIDNTAASVDSLIVDDDSLINIAAGAPSQDEGTGANFAYVFQVNRVGYIDDVDSVSWAVTGSGSNPASANDFVGGVLPSGSVGFPPGNNGVFVEFEVAGDAVEESDETFTVTLSSPIGGEIGTATMSATIINDDTNSDQIFSDRFQ